jgi:hypothetical protein
MSVVPSPLVDVDISFVVVRVGNETLLRLGKKMPSAGSFCDQGCALSDGMEGKEEEEEEGRDPCGKKS